MALRLARFNARIDVEEQPHKSAGFLTGVPAPVGAGLLLLPMILWLASNREWAWLQDYRLVAPWAAFVAFLAGPSSSKSRAFISGEGGEGSWTRSGIGGGGVSASISGASSMVSKSGSTAAWPTF